MTRTLAVLLRLKPACMVLAFGILGMRSGIADGVLALGSAKGGPTFGWAAGFSKAGADAALNECRGKYKCEVVATFHDQCFAISSNGTATQWKSPIGFGLAIEKDSATAAQGGAGKSIDADSVRQLLSLFQARVAFSAKH